MNVTLILPRERELLLQRRYTDHAKGDVLLHALDSDVFYYLCAKTDWKTGRIGERSAVSYARIAIALNEDIPRKPTRLLRRVKRKCVNNSVQRLIKAGLLASLSVSDAEQKRLMVERLFWSEMLQADSSSTNPDNRQLANLMQTLMRHKSFNNNDLAQEKNPVSDVSFSLDGTYQYNNISNGEIDQKFSMRLAWKADKRYVDRFLQACGFSGTQIKKIWFGKYVQYWSTQPAVQRTQREWSTHFANHMQGYLLRPDYFEEVNGMLENNRDRNRNRDTATTRRSIRRPYRAQQASKKAGYLSVPMLSDGAQLQRWAVANGLQPAPAGADTTAYYRLLCQQVEIVNQAQEKRQLD